MGKLDRDPKSEAYDRLDFSPDSSGRHRFINRRTNAMLEVARNQIGFELVVIQGSYMLPSEAAQASDATHNGGGVVDIRTRDIPARIGTTRAVRALREVGFAAFHRTAPPFSEDHIHAVAIGDAELDPTAASQVTQYVNGGDGLGGTDTGPKVRPVVTFDYDTQGIDMQLTDTIPGTKGRTVADALKAALEAERSIEVLTKRQAKRHQRLLARQKALTKRVQAATKAVNGLPDGVTKQEVSKLLQDIDATVQLVVEDADDSAEPGTTTTKTAKTAKKATTKPVV